MSTWDTNSVCFLNKIYTETTNKNMFKKFQIFLTFLSILREFTVQLSMSSWKPKCRFIYGFYFNGEYVCDYLVNISLVP